MNPVEFTKALIRLSAYQVGIKEAPILFLCKDGTTVKQVARILGVDNSTAVSRLNMIRLKKLIYSTKLPDKPCTYHCTDRGMEIILTTLQSKVLTP